MFKAILVPTDGSRHANTALTIARDLAARHGARLLLLHVVTKDGSEASLAHFAELESLPTTETTRHVRHIEATPHGPVAIPGGTIEQVDYRAAATEVAYRFLHSSKENLACDEIKEVSVFVEHGDAAKSILAFASREQVDAIIMGSRGLSDLKGTLFGSVSHKVAHDADCVCITVTDKRKP